MKKCLSFIFVLLLVFCMTGCDPETYYFDKNYYEGLVEKIELRYSENDEAPFIIKIEEGDTPHFRIQDSELVETLENSKNNDFVNEFAKITFHRIYECCNQPFGYIVVMYLTTENFIVISCSPYGKRSFGFFAEFDCNEEFIQCLGSFAEASAYKRLLINLFQSYSERKV